MRFVILVEGDAESIALGDFLHRWLDPQLDVRAGIKVVRHQGNAELMRKIVAKAQDYLDGPDASETVGVIGLLDLYGLPIYPAALSTVRERYDWAKKEFERQVARDRFRMFFAVHEFEAWILGEPAVLPRPVREALPKNALHPEQVNFDEPPAKLLDRLYLSHLKKRYKKTTYGRQLFGQLSPQIVADKCPYLKAMLTEMLRLAKTAGL